MNRHGMAAELMLPHEGEDIEDRKEATQDLRQVLSIIGISSLASTTRSYLSADGMRSYEAIASSIIVMLTSATTLRLVIKTIQVWLIEKNRHSVKIEIDGKSIEITGGSEESQREYVENFLSLFQDRLDSIESSDG